MIYWKEAYRVFELISPDSIPPDLHQSLRELVVAYGGVVLYDPDVPEFLIKVYGDTPAWILMEEAVNLINAYHSKVSGGCMGDGNVGL